MVMTCSCLILHASPTSLTGSSRLPRPMSIEEMFQGDNAMGNGDVNELAYELRTQRKRNNPSSERFSRMNRHQELTNLYGKIAKEFPFLLKQGLLNPNDRKVSIDDLLSMTVFGQPKMGKK